MRGDLPRDFLCVGIGSSYRRSTIRKLRLPLRPFVSNMHQFQWGLMMAPDIADWRLFGVGLRRCGLATDGLRRDEMVRGNSKLEAARRAPSERIPGRRPGAAQRAEVLRVWDALDEDGRKVLLFTARQAAREKGLIDPNMPLVITDRAF